MCPTLWTVSPPGSSVHGTIQARVLEWVAEPSSRGSSWSREGTYFSCVPCMAGDSFPKGHQGSPMHNYKSASGTNFCISVTLIILKSLIPCVIIGQAYAIFLARVKALFGPGSCPSNSFIPPKGLQSACLLCQGRANVPLVVNGLHHLCMWKPRHYSPLHMLIEEQWCGESK